MYIDQINIVQLFRSDTCSSYGYSSDARSSYVYSSDGCRSYVYSLGQMIYFALMI